MSNFDLIFAANKVANGISSDNKRDSSWVLWALGLIFVALKLMGYITWSWIWVLCPIWIPIAIVLIFGMLIGFVKGIRDALKRDKENKWMDLYMFALVAFNFEDYENFHKNSSADDFNTALNFCDQILSFALIKNQFLIFLDALSAKAHVYAYDGDYESFLDYDLQRFILGLNPIMMDSKTYASYDIINEANVINLKNVLDKFDFGSLKKRFDNIWAKSHITNITVPKKISYKTLQKAISGADIDELNFDLREKYFNKKFGI